MSLKKYNCCDQKHADDFQYVCLKDKKVFCVKCWYKVQHYRHCQSSRCGQYHKIAHLVLNRGLQYKNSKLMEHMASNHANYQALRVNFLQLNFKVTQTLKEFVQQKMPLLFWAMVNQLLRSRCGPETPEGYYKFDSYCTEMLNIIKSTDTSMKQEYLESAIGAYFDINHQIQGELNSARSNRFTNNNHKQDDINDILERTKNQLNGFMKNMKMGFRKTMDEQLKRSTMNIDQAVSYPGVSFKKITPQNQCFRKRQQYPYLNLVSQKYSRITNEEQELHMGFHMNVATLEANPQQLLQVGKCLLKQRLFEFYESINTIKTIFPYKYAYPISTTLSYDQDYEQMLISLQRAAISPSGKTNPFLSSMTLVIMGRDVVVIRFSNTPKFQYSRKIYNFRPDRKQYYSALITMLDLSNTPMRPTGIEEEIVYTEEMTQVELAYCNLRVAYENIFMYNGEDLIFEGEKTMANRGAEQFSQMIEKWRKNAMIELPFVRTKEDLMKDFL